MTKTDKRKGDWIQTYTGQAFWPLDPRPSEVHIADIAHSLANQCRFAGHSLTYFSVAQHSVLVSDNLPPELAKWGLLHDASEAYLVDVPRPVKRSIQGYNEIEEQVMAAIAMQIGLSWPMPELVHVVDAEALATERRDLMAPCERRWACMPEPWPEIIAPLGQVEAELLFLKRAHDLGVHYASEALAVATNKLARAAANAHPWELRP